MLKRSSTIGGCICWFLQSCKLYRQIKVHTVLIELLCVHSYLFLCPLHSCKTLYKHDVIEVPFHTILGSGHISCIEKEEILVYVSMIILFDLSLFFDCRLLFEDNDHGLWTVTLFNKVIDEYKMHARENK